MPILSNRGIPRRFLHTFVVVQQAPPDLRLLPPEKLIELTQSAYAEQAWAEVKRRLSATPLANQLADRLLRQGDADAWEGLIRCCWKAVMHLYLPPDADADSFEAKRRVIGDALQKLLEPYYGQSKEEILLLALKGQFSHLPNAVRCDLIDELRKRYSSKTVTLFSVTSLDVQRQDGFSPGCELTELVRFHKDDLSSILDPADLEILLDAAEFAEADSNSRKGDLTRYIAEKRGIKPRAAQDRKKRLQGKLQKAIRDGHPAACGLRALLDRKPEEFRVYKPPESEDESEEF